MFDSAHSTSADAGGASQVWVAEVFAFTPLWGPEIGHTGQRMAQPMGGAGAVRWHTRQVSQHG